MVKRQCGGEIPRDEHIAAYVEFESLRAHEQRVVDVALHDALHRRDGGLRVAGLFSVADFLQSIHTGKHLGLNNKLEMKGV